MIPPWVMRTLRSLRDVTGVEGSFVFREEGTLLARDLPDVLADDLLTEIAGRLSVLVEAARSSFGDSEAAFLTFRDHALVVFCEGPLGLAVLANPAIHPDTLQLGARLALRKLVAGVQPGGASGGTPRLPRPPSLPRVPSAPASSVSAPRGPRPRPAAPPGRARKKRRGIWGD